MCRLVPRTAPPRRLEAAYVIRLLSPAPHPVKEFLNCSSFCYSFPHLHTPCPVARSSGPFPSDRPNSVVDRTHLSSLSLTHTMFSLPPHHSQQVAQFYFPKRRRRCRRKVHLSLDAARSHTHTRTHAHRTCVWTNTCPRVSTSVCRCRRRHDHLPSPCVMMRPIGGRGHLVYTSGWRTYLPGYLPGYLLDSRTHRERRHAVSHVQTASLAI